MIPVMGGSGGSTSDQVKQKLKKVSPKVMIIRVLAVRRTRRGAVAVKAKPKKKGKSLRVRLDKM